MTVSSRPERDTVLRLRDGRALAIAEWGPVEGRPVLVLHGNPGSRLFCPDVETTHAAGVRVITSDRPGYGGSDPRPGRTLLDWGSDVMEVADQLGLDRFSIVGISGGGPFTMACTIKLGPRVRSIALCGSDAPIDEAPQTLALYSARGRGLIKAIRADAAAARAAVLERFADYGRDYRSMMAPIDAAIASAPVESLPIDLREMAKPVMRAAFEAMLAEGARQGATGLADDTIAMVSPWGFSPSNIACPTTIWWGEDDHIVDRVHSDYLAAAVPGARYRVLPGAGHGLPDLHWPEVLADLEAG
jgi:pimeloyl-ACP methyl ester carboxylesterase